MQELEREESADQIAHNALELMAAEVAILRRMSRDTVRDVCEMCNRPYPTEDVEIEVEYGRRYHAAQMAVEAGE